MGGDLRPRRVAGARDHEIGEPAVIGQETLAVREFRHQQTAVARFDA
ncbi:MAG: hypothetical protein ACLPN5_23575 [Roseiarcus sp.]